MPEQSVSSVAVDEWYGPVVEVDPESGRVEAGQVRPSGEDMAWVLADLAAALAVEVYGLHVSSVSLRYSEFWVEGVEVFAHVKDLADAVRVAGVFGLVGVDELREDGWVWRTWTGWDADESRCGFPVCVRITACVSRGEC